MTFMPKWYDVPEGVKGLLRDGRWMLFASDEDYFDYVE